MGRDRMFILGLDGATLDYISPWAEAGYLPHLNRLLQEGVSGTLESTIPPVSPVAWSSLFTGLNPGKHGIFGWYKHRPGSPNVEPVNARDIRGKTVIDLASEANLCVGLIGFPLMYPPQPINGFSIPGFFIPGSEEERKLVYPSDLLDEVRIHCGSYTLHRPPFSLQAANIEQYLAEHIRAMDERTEAALYLWNRYNCDLLFLLIDTTDHFNHIGRSIENLRAAYEAADRNLGNIISTLGDDTALLVVSDHGSTQRNGLFYVNKWLMQNGMLRFLHDRERTIPTEALRADRLRRFLSRKVPRLMKRIVPSKKAGNLIAALLTAAWQGMPCCMKEQIIQKFRHNLTNVYQNIDWDATVAYAPTSFGQISINTLKVAMSSEKYRSLIEVIIQGLEALTKPSSGSRVVKRVFRREELYWGPHVDRSPDLVFVLENEADSAVPFEFPDRPVLWERFQASYGGCHTSRGLFMAQGEQFRLRTEVSMHIWDVMPNILYCLGLGIPRQVDGVVNEGLYTDEFMRTRGVPKMVDIDDEHYYHSDTPTSVYSDDELAELTRHLQQLGYL